jgi:dGTP triphosphohydrolase
MFGNSIVFRSGESRFEEEIGENEEIVTKEYVSIVSLNASDLVDTPAATESLFSEDLTAAKATAFLEENPEIEELLFSNPEIVEQFLHRYENYKSKKNKMDKSFSEKVLDVLKGAGINFGAKEEVENTEVVETEAVATEEVETVEEEATVAEEATTEEFSAEESNEAIAQAVEKFEEEREELVKEFNAKETDLNHALAELGEEVKSLKAELEVKETELAAFNVKPTEVEGNEDPSIKGEEKQLSENASVLKDFLKDIKE